MNTSFRLPPCEDTVSWQSAGMTLAPGLGSNAIIVRVRPEFDVSAYQFRRVLWPVLWGPGTRCLPSSRSREFSQAYARCLVWRDESVSGGRVPREAYDDAALETSE